MIPGSTSEAAHCTKNLVGGHYLVPSSYIAQPDPRKHFCSWSLQVWSPPAGWSTASRRTTILSTLVTCPLSILPICPATTPINSQFSKKLINDKDRFFFQESLKTSLTVLAETSLCLTTRQSTSRCEICTFYRNELHLPLKKIFSKCDIVDMGARLCQS